MTILGNKAITELMDELTMKESNPFPNSSTFEILQEYNWKTAAKPSDFASFRGIKHSCKLIASKFATSVKI